MNPAFGFCKGGESLNRQWHQSRLFLFGKHLDHLLAGGSVNAGVGDMGFPAEQMVILLVHRTECFAPKGIILDIRDPAFDLALVTGRIGLGRQEDGAVILAEGLEFGVKFGIIPVRLADCRLQIVNNKRLRNAPKVMEGVFEAHHKSIGGLPEYGFAVAATAMTERHTKDMAAPDGCRQN